MLFDVSVGHKGRNAALQHVAVRKSTWHAHLTGEDGCHNPFTKKQDAMEESDRNGIVKRMPILMLLKRREMRMNLM